MSGMDELHDDNVICPGCAHDFPAIPQSARDRIAELEAMCDQLASDKDRATAYNCFLLGKLERLEDRLKDTVTTKYHDQIVREAVTRAAKAERKLERFMAGI